MLKWSLSGAAGSMNRCFTKINQTVVGPTIVKQMVNQHEQVWL